MEKGEPLRFTRYTRVSAERTFISNPSNTPLTAATTTQPAPLGVGGLRGRAGAAEGNAGVRKNIIKRPLKVTPLLKKMEEFV